MNDVERLYGLFGGMRPLSRALGVNVTLISRWKEHGMVPPSWNLAIKEAAAEALPVINMKEVEACLQENVCPCCKQQLPVGAVVDRRFYSARAA